MSVRKAIESVARVAKRAAKSVVKDPIGSAVGFATLGGVGSAASLLGDAATPRPGPAPEAAVTRSQPEDVDAVEREASGAVDDETRQRRGRASTQVVRSLLGPSGSGRRTLLGV